VIICGIFVIVLPDSFLGLSDLIVGKVDMSLGVVDISLGVVDMSLGVVDISVTDEATAGDEVKVSAVLYKNKVSSYRIFISSHYRNLISFQFTLILTPSTDTSTETTSRQTTKTDVIIRSL